MILKINKIINKYSSWQEFKINDFFLILIGVILAAFLRIGFIDYMSGDYANFMSKWYDGVVNDNDWDAFGKKVYYYSPLYFHLLSVTTILPIPKLYMVKFIPILFDFLLAGIVSLIVRERYPNIWIAKLSFLLVLFVPSVFLNSAAWGKFDAIYTFFLLTSIYFAIGSRYFLSFIAFAISFSFKLQAAFLLPLFFILFLRKRFNIFYFLLIPLLYALTIFSFSLPEKNFLNLLQIYISQFYAFGPLNMNSINFYAFIPNKNYDLLKSIGMILPISIIYLIFFSIHKSKKNITEKDFIIKISLVFLCISDFFVPIVHEYYFFPASVISIIYFFYFPKYFYIPILIIFASTSTYMGYIFQEKFDKVYAILSMFIVIVIITADLFISLYKNEKIIKHTIGTSE